MNQKLIDKIKKLLALSSSPVKAEAELALSKAKLLMEEYGISLIEDQTESIIEKMYDYPNGRLNRDFQCNLVSIADSIAQMFNCIVLIRDNKPCVIGLATNVEVCFHALDCILNSLWFDYREMRRNNPSLVFSTNFWEGASEGIREKFHPKKDTVRSESGLILYDQVRNWINEKYPHLGSWNPSRNSADSVRGRDAGINAGSSAQIRPGIRTQDSGRKLLN